MSAFSGRAGAKGDRPRDVGGFDATDATSCHRKYRPRNQSRIDPSRRSSTITRPPRYLLPASKSPYAPGEPILRGLENPGSDIRPERARS